MIKIRLMRIGAKKKPFYRVVVLDERAKRTGAYIELLGTYNPLTEPKDIKLKKERIDYWVKQGAQFSTGYLRIIGKAPQRPPRKPKKESKQDQKTTETPAAETVKPGEPETVVTPSVSEAPASEDTVSQQTGIEAEEKPSEPEKSESSDASATNEPTTEEKQDQPSEESESESK